MPSLGPNVREISDAVLGSETHPVDAQEASAETSRVEVRQAIRIGPLRLLLDFSSTSRLSEMVPITPVPAAPPWLKGLASLRGSVLPVVDLAVLGGIDVSSVPRPYLLVLGRGENAIAILIDGLPERFRLTASHGNAPHAAPEWLVRSVLQAYAQNDEVWLDLDCNCLLEDIAGHMRTAVTP